MGADMSDVEVSHAEQATRADTARALSALAEALGGDGKVELTLGPTTMSVRVPDEIQCKIEVEIDRDEVEFEIELRWSTTPRRQTVAHAGSGQTEPEADRGAGTTSRPAPRRKADAR
jgi:amphi-Trp domain-containing protein